MLQVDPIESDFSFEEEEEEEDSQKALIHKLTTVWINERSAPELLPYSQLIDEIQAKLETSNINDISDIFINSILQQEHERFCFLVRSYLKARLQKIEKFSLFFLDSEYRDRLSPEEVRYANNYQTIVQKYYLNSFLNQLPESLRKIDENGDQSVNMVISPDLEESVFIKSEENIDFYKLEDMNETISLMKNDVCLVRYSSIRRLLEQERISLL